MTQFEEKVLKDLAELKIHMRWLVGDGNEGKMQQLEQRMEKHEAALQRIGGIGATIGVLITIAHVAMEYWRVVHR